MLTQKSTSEMIEEWKTLYEKQDALFKGCKIIVGVELETAFFYG